ncbi:MAG: hypothetical protein A2X52_21145 [Candidatus Rokubacteria bacterium GWC2_70_16]|nr:MAG: hypothetical protein A2X52_21145 [Candidatus Rokubacteria bacterium GWC2_70_16]
MNWDYEVDVAVVGGGACGLMTALRAGHSPSLRVAVFEKGSRLMSNAQISSGTLAAAGTRFQKAAGIVDAPERHAEDVIRKNHGRCDRDVVLALCSAAPRYVEYLADALGHPVELAPDMSRVGHSVPRLHSDKGRTGGATLVKNLKRGLAAAPNITFVDKLLWMYSISANLVVVREETGIKSIYELSGKKFNPGFRGSAVEKSSEVAFGVLGIKPDWQRMGTADVVDAMKDKRIVGFAKAGAGYGHDASTMDIATQVPLRTLPYSEEDMKKIKAARPHIPWVKVPAGSIKGMGEFWTTVSLAFVAASKDMPPELAYRLVKAIWDGQEHQPQSVMGVAYKNPGLSAQLALSPLHAGAIKYYRELGFKVPDHLVPPEAK